VPSLSQVAAAHNTEVDLVVIKGELNRYNKWQSDDLFHIVINENHPHDNEF